MIKKFDDLTVVEFGNGTVTVELGKYGSQYAVFINNTDTPGMPGQLAPKTKNPRGYEPDEIVLVFPTKKRAAGVVNSLFNGELVKVEGRQHPAPAVQGEPVAWMHSDPGRVDVIHDKVRKLLKDSSDNAGYLHRPLDKSERYTIPLYTAPQPTEQQQQQQPYDSAAVRLDKQCREAVAAALGFIRGGDYAWSYLLQQIKDITSAAEAQHPAEQQPAPDVTQLVDALESLIKGYVGLLEAGKDRITSLGGDCDPVPVMEKNDPWLRGARAALAAYRNQGGDV